jgi:hypothetical protein
MSEREMQDLLVLLLWATGEHFILGQKNEKNQKSRGPRHVNILYRQTHFPLGSVTEMHFFFFRKLILERRKNLSHALNIITEVTFFNF